MKRLLKFDEAGYYLDEEIVPDGTKPLENEYLADIDEDIDFYYPRFVDGKLVEGLTPEEIAERENQVPQVPTDPVFEKLETIEQQMQADSITQFDVMATMYEEILNLRAEVEALKGVAPQ